MQEKAEQAWDGAPEDRRRTDQGETDRPPEGWAERTSPLPRVAFQGEPGAFSEEAIWDLFGEEGATSVACPTFQGAFQVLEGGEADYALLPVENSYAGSVHDVYDLLLGAAWAVILREVVHPVHHLLLATDEVILSDVKRALSHPQALMQCAPFLREHGIQPVAVQDTAGAARQVAEARPLDAAAVAGRGAMRRYGLRALAMDIEATSDNSTRFWLLGREAIPVSGSTKASVVVWLDHRPGALAECLDVLAARGMNLTKIESRPTREGRWEYVFYLDFEAQTEAQIHQALDLLERRSAQVRCLGIYAPNL